MGVNASSLYNHCRRIALKYNAENRAQKFLDKGKLAKAPRHPLPENIQKRDMVLSEQELQELHGKNEQLNDYLKKVYLTSNSKITGIPSTRPKPKKENERFKVAMFVEPEKASPGHCTLTNIVEILSKYQNDSETWNPHGIARMFNLDKKDVFNLLMYYSLFTVERFDFLKNEPIKPEEEEKIEFEVYEQLEKKPFKRIGAK